MKRDILDTLALRGKKVANREKLMPFMVLAIVAITLVIFVRPMVNKIADINKKRAEREKVLASLTKQRSMLTAIQQENLIDSQYVNTERYLPSNNSIKS